MNNVRSWHRFGFLGFGGPGSPIETGALDQMISILVTITSPMENIVFFPTSAPGWTHRLIRIKSLSEGTPLSDVESKYQNLRYECVLRFYLFW